MTYLPVYASAATFFFLLAMVALLSALSRRSAAADSRVFDATRGRSRRLLLMLWSLVCFVVALAAGSAAIAERNRPFQWGGLLVPFPKFHAVELVAYVIVAGFALSILLASVPLLRPRFRAWYTLNCTLAVICGVLAAHLHLDPRAFIPFYGAGFFLVLALVVGRLGRFS